MNESNKTNARSCLPSRGGESSARRRTSRALLLFLALAPLCACSSKHSSDAEGPKPGAGPLPECEEYASRYEACLSGAGSADVAHRRAQATRDAFTAAIGDKGDLTELRKTCAAGLARLHCR
jgi:hypothetical protein